MPPPYQPNHLTALRSAPYVPLGAVGVAPATWVRRNRLTLPTGLSLAALPTLTLNRAQVRAICTNPALDVRLGYICVMAWGGQGSGPGGASHAISAWHSISANPAQLHTLRAGGLSRCQAYSLFSGSGAVPGLGPSFLTKLLYFFSPTPDFYIMDQWTSKSVNLLNGFQVVHMAGNAPSTANKCGNYQAFCEEIDHIAAILGSSGQIAEERLFSHGGKSPAPWRAHVLANWPPAPPFPSYSKTALHRRYSHIPAVCF